MKLIAKVLKAIAINAIALLYQAMQLRQSDVGSTQVGALATACLVEIQHVPATRSTVIEIDVARKRSLIDVLGNVRVVLALPASLHTISASYLAGIMALAKPGSGYDSEIFASINEGLSVDATALRLFRYGQGHENSTRLATASTSKPPAGRPLQYSTQALEKSAPAGLSCLRPTVFASVVTGSLIAPSYNMRMFQHVPKRRQSDGA